MVHRTDDVTERLSRTPYIIVLLSVFYSHRESFAKNATLLPHFASKPNNQVYYINMKIDSIMHI